MLESWVNVWESQGREQMQSQQDGKIQGSSKLSN